ncbi:STAG-domain-containing protein [Aureobasidium pullulans EXF-150]|uniref:STAG-domain-containing protein n=1 Tax=Aureobasidium pullulans EXF-150 TaxID=1043002 RepID=A0A074XB23_AURPU|nr:STAG-domain-containing protein [Aureobasidium pullulans EXF-150]KEQ82553.1 STAG-domain-containing protein [Aureobasidium pullulans EXF-150]
MSSPLSEAPEEAAPAANEPRSRRSGRVLRKPELYIEETPAASKRKRDAGDEDQEDQNDDEEESEEDESEPGEEELREQKAKARKTKAAAPKKPAAKRPKTNGTSVALPVRAVAKKGRSKKAKGVDEAAAEEAGGLYAEVFARGKTLDEAAEDWLKSFEEHESRAVADLVNFVLRSAGCDLEVTHEDIEDPDNCAGKLGDLQEEFQAQNLSEYPIIAKGKGTAAFKDSLTGFFYTLIKAIHTNQVLFSNIELIENIQVWLSTMSAAQNRPFRHTATVVSLAVITALCEIGSELADEASKALRHAETQKKSKNANKTRVSELQTFSKQAKANQEILDNTVKDWFDTIYIHRYRDVDPHIRVDCAKALGDWIVAYPDQFFDGQHLRYLGWVLSDTNHSTRLEVIKQLHRLYADKDKLGGLKTFTERFRGRMVEMATRDAESSVRAATVELLDDLREGGLLEPDDIDAIGRLIFDAEPRVRKSVVGFFAESINDAYEAKVDALGGQEALEEILGEDNDSYDSPSQEWIKFKCLAEGLDSYDSADGPLPQNVEKGPGQGGYLLHTGSAESRFLVAADTLNEQIEEVREWEKLAGYLLYDTSVEDQNGDAASGESQLKQELKLTESEEVILLEVLNSSVKQAVASLVEVLSDKKTKKTKKQKEDVEGMQEQAARHLANLIPRLLKKFGESPQTAASTLRLGRVLSLEAFQEFRQDSSTYATLLNDFNKQFLSHSNEEVLAEASRALLRAKSYHELGDVPDERIDTLWEDTITTFSTITQDKDLETRGGMSTTILDGISRTVLRLEKLSSISNPVEYFETEPTVSSTARPETSEPSPPIDFLIALINRAASPKGSDPETAALDDAVAMHASRTVCFYFMWRIPAFIQALQTTALPDIELENLATRRDAYINALGAVLKSRPVADELSPMVAGMLLDIHTLMARLRHVNTDKNGDEYLVLALEMDAVLQKRILRVFGAVESTFAKASGKHVEVEAENSQAQESEDEDEEPADPIDEDPESDPSDDEADVDDEQQTQASQVKRVQKLQNSLLAEQRLCELSGKLVLAILGRMVNATAIKQRLERNKTRLGPNFKGVLEHLDTQTKNKKGKGKITAVKTGAQQTKAKPAPQQQKSKEVVVEDDSEEEDEEAVCEKEIIEDDEMPDANDEGGNEEEKEQDEVAADAESVAGD